MIHRSWHPHRAMLLLEINIISPRIGILAYGIHVGITHQKSSRKICTAQVAQFTLRCFDVSSSHLSVVQNYQQRSEKLRIKNMRRAVSIKSSVIREEILQITWASNALTIDPGNPAEDRNLASSEQNSTCVRASSSIPHPPVLSIYPFRKNLAPCVPRWPGLDN
jgi:hypothetical protein